MNFSTSTDNNVGVYEYSGLDTTAPLDQVTGNTGNSTSPNGGNLVTSQNGELYFVVGVYDWGNDANATAGSGYTIQDQQADVDTHERFYTEAKVANAGTHATNFTIGSASKWAVIGASFKPAAIAASSSGSLAATFSYDLNGNMASDGAKLYQYNEANQLETVKLASNSATIAEYVYDYKGQRMVKENYNSGTLANTVISWSNGFETKAIVGGATETTNYYFANNELVAKKDNSGNKVYFHNDHLGSNSITTNQAGAQVENVTYDPWGKVLGAATQSKYLYTGQEHDGETGLHYYDARYYDSELRRFTQPDTIIQDIYNPQALNRYSYALNNPLKYIDPSGHLSILDYNNSLTQYYKKPSAITYNNVLNTANAIRNQYTQLTSLPAQASSRGGSGSGSGGGSSSNNKVDGLQRGPDPKQKSDPAATIGNFVNAARDFKISEVRSGGICIGSNAGIAGFISGGGCGVITAHGEIAFMPNYGEGASTGIATGAGPSLMLSTATNVGDLAGNDIGIGASVAMVQADFSTARDNSNIRALTIGFQPGLDISFDGKNIKAPGEIHVQAIYSYPLLYHKF